MIPFWELLALEASEDPERPVLVSDDVTLTAAGVDRCSEELARHLRARGVRPEVAVVVYLGRSPAAAVAVAAALRAGGVVVPLDPPQPLHRLDAVLAASRPACVVTNEESAADLAPDAPPAVLVDACGILHGDRRAARDSSAAQGPDPENVAFAFFTAGTTGAPRGVLVPYRAALGDFRPRQARGRVFLATSAGPPAIVEGLVRPMATGATVVFPRAVAPLDPREIADLVHRHRVTSLSLPPQFLKRVARHLDEGDWRAIEVIEWTGAGVEPDLLAALPPASGTRVKNVYGAAETGAIATWEATAADPPATVPLRTAAEGTMLTLVDEELEPVAEGADGEVVVAGPRVARGYLGDPALTAERFVPDPRAPEPGARMYRTGDVARRSPGGSVELRGRVDRQVEVRGNRVEPDEVEAVLRLHPLVRNAAVVPTGPRTEARLLAAVVPTRGAPLPVTEMRRFLSLHLPGYMIPTSWKWLDALPVTSDGEIDATRLLEEDVPARRSGRFAGAEAVDPSTGVLARCWQEVLGIDGVKPEDNFFDLGGDSMLAVRAAGAMTDALGVGVHPEVLYQAPTLRELSARLREQVASLEPARQRSR